MANSIISNIAALSAQSNIKRASMSAASSIARLSSGNRIAKASDDVSGLATGTALRTQVTTLRQALGNATQGSSLLQVADGAAVQIIDILQRQKAIATQASSGQLTDTNRSLLNQEFTNLSLEIDRISASTNFNGVALLAGTLGTNTTLERTNALAASAVVAAPSNQVGATGVVSATAIQAFSIATGTAASAAGAAIGQLTITDSTGTTLANAAYLNVDANLYGQFGSFNFSNVSYGSTGTATLTTTINGSTYTGTVSNNATSVVLQNGNTYIKIGTGTVSLTDSASASNTLANITTGFRNTYIAKTNVVNGVNFTGTALNGAIGNASSFVTARLASAGSLNISNFTYVAGIAANNNTLTVQVNGQTFTANGVKDAIGNGTLQFVDGTGLQTVTINMAGLAATSAVSTGNIRTDATLRATFIAALNTGFSKAGGNGLNFSIGTLATDTINVTLGSTTTNSLYGGQALDVSTAATATNASAVLDNAITKATSVEAAIGALESRFNFASNAIQSSIENQDAARSELLDTDVSAESTRYAAAQVQTQAGIAVLAQANQLPQALLKLIQ